MANSLERLASKLHSLEDQVRSLRQPQLGSSSIESGAIEEYSGDTLVQIIGEQYDGTHGAVTMNGPKPPQPTPLILTPVPGGLSIRWDGDFFGEQVAPANFQRVDLHVSSDPSAYASAPLMATSLVGSVSTARGGQLFVPLSADVHTAWAVAWNSAGLYSDVSEARTATPEPYEAGGVATDGLPPAASPAPVVVGAIGAMAISIPAVTNADPVTYDLYGTSADPTTVPVVPTTGPPLATLMTDDVGLVFVRTVDGEPVVNPNIYRFVVVARDADGGVAAGPEASGTPALGKAGDVDVFDMLVASEGFIEALNVVDLSTTTLSSLSLDIGGIMLTPQGGLVIPDVATFSAELSRMRGNFTAESLVVENFLKLQGMVNEIATGAQLALARGVTPPPRAPTVEASWPISRTLNAVNPAELRGLIYYWDGSAATAYQATARSRSSGGGFIEVYDNGGNLTSSLDLKAITGYNFDPQGGVCQQMFNGALHFYALCTIPGSSDWWIVRVAKDGSSFAVRDHPTDRKFRQRPTISAYSSSYICVTGMSIDNATTAPDKGLPRMRTFFYDPAITNGVSYSSTMFSGGNQGPTAVGGVIWQAGVPGSPSSPVRTILFNNDDDARTWVDGFGTPAAVPAEDFPRPYGLTVVGATKAAGTPDWHHVLCPNGRIYRLNSNVAISGEAAYSFVDLDPAGTGEHETPLSPVATFATPRGATADITAVMPGDTGDVDSPTQPYIYARPNATAAWGRSGLYVSGKLDVARIYYSSPTDGAYGTRPTFDAANLTPAKIITPQAQDANGSPLVQLVGDGSWRLGPLAGDKDGLLVRDPQHIVGAAGEPAFSSGFTQWSAGSVWFRRTFTREFVVISYDMAIPAGVAQGAIMFTLPVGWRPMFDVPGGFWAWTNGQNARLIVGLDGTVKFYALNGASVGTRLAGTMSVPI